MTLARDPRKRKSPAPGRAPLRRERPYGSQALALVMCSVPRVIASYAAAAIILSPSSSSMPSARSVTAIIMLPTCSTIQDIPTAHNH